jgi:polyphosphate kinase 2 (PPK2 family)
VISSTTRSNGKLKRKVYDKELACLHVELVKLQEWVKHKGLKVCVVTIGVKRRNDVDCHSERVEYG